MNKVLSYKVPITIADSATAGSLASIPINGIMKGYSITAPNLTGTVTVTLAITDVWGTTVYSKASIAENATTTSFVDANNFPYELPLVGPITVTITASGAQTGDQSLSVIIYYI